MASSFGVETLKESNLFQKWDKYQIETKKKANIPTIAQLIKN